MIRYTREYYPMLCDWSLKRGIPVTQESLLPPFGFIVEDVAAGFLYRTDSGLCLIEGVITNPDAPNKVRGAAVDEIIKEICKEASAQGFEHIVGFTGIYGMAKRTEKQNFTVHPSKYMMVTRRLAWDSSATQ